MRNFFNPDWLEMLKQLKQLKDMSGQSSKPYYQQTSYGNNTADLSYRPTEFMPNQNYNVQKSPFSETPSNLYRETLSFEPNHIPKYTDIFGENQFPEFDKLQQYKRNIISEAWDRIDDGINTGGIVQKNNNLELPNILNKRQNELGKSFVDNWGNSVSKPMNTQSNLEKQLEENFESEVKVEQPKPDIPKPQEIKPLTLEEHHQKAKEFKSLYSDVN